MKNLLVIAITAASLVAVAQTPSTTTATTAPAVTAPTTATATTPATAPKAKKAKAAKKAVKPAAQMTAPATAPTATTSSASPAIETQGETSTAPAAGTSTTAVKADGSVKNWSASLVLQATASNDDLKNVGIAEIDTLSIIGAGYKVSATDKIGIRQYFSYKTTPNNANRIEQEVTAVTYGTKTTGVFGSDAIAPLFWYFLPTAQLTKAANTEQAINHNGTLRLDAEIAWTLNPKWTVSYFLNPRQSLVYKQNYINRKGEAKSIEADTRLIHNGVVYYNFADTIQAYSSAGLDQRARTATLTSHSDDALLAVGANFAMGNFSLNPEMSNTVSLKKEGGTVAAPRWLQTDDLSYVLTAALAF